MSLSGSWKRLYCAAKLYCVNFKTIRFTAESIRLDVLVPEDSKDRCADEA